MFIKIIRNKILLLILIFSNLIFAREVFFSGKIIEKATGQRVENANIIIAGVDLGTVSDNTGSFSIKLETNKQFTYKVKHIGFQTYSETIRIENINRVYRKIELIKKVERVSPVVVTARGYETEINNIPGSIGIVNQNQISFTSPLGVANIAETIPGINKTSDMPWGSDINIRGLGRDKIVVLINGNRLSTATAIPARFGTITPQDIHRIEILKGPLSVQYGTGSIGGVANIITKSGNFSSQPGWNFELNNSFESIAQGKSTYGRINYNSDKFYFSLSQSYRDYEDYTAGNNIDFPNSQFTDYQTNFNLGYKLNNRNRLELTAQYMEAKNVGIPGGGEQFPPTARAIYPKTSRALYEFQWNYHPAPKFWQKTKLEAYYQPLVREVELIPKVINDSTKMMVNPGADHHVVGFKWQNVFNLGRHNLTAGLEGWQRAYRGYRYKKKVFTYKDNQILQKDKPLPDSRYRPLGIYAEDEYQLNNKMKLNLGARFDQIHIQNEKTYMTIKPPSDSIRWEASEDTDYSYSLQSGLIYSINSTLDFNFLIARAFRSPSLEERYQYIDLGSIVKVGDPALDSESSWFFESGIDWQTEYFIWNTNIFYNLTRDLVIDKPGTYEGKDALIKNNAGKARLYGIDAQIKWLIDTGFYLKGRLDYTKGYDLEKDQNLPSMPPLHFNFVAHYELFSNVWSELVLEGAAEQNQTAPGESETPGFYILNIKAGYKNFDLMASRHSVNFGIKNLLDRQYKRHLTRSRGFELYEPGRSFYINWNIRI